MSKYTVKFYDGDYPERQEKANKDGAICYFEQHFNSIEYDDPLTQKDNPILTIVAHNASDKSRRWAYEYSKEVRNKFPRYPKFIGDAYEYVGVLQRKYKERGDYNLRFTSMPAILGEPLFVSDEATANMLMETDRDAQCLLAQALVDSITSTFPKGGLVAFSIGHMGKTSQPFDRGAPVKGYPESSEAAIADYVLGCAARLLEALPNTASPGEPWKSPRFNVAPNGPKFSVASDGTFMMQDKKPWSGFSLAADGLRMLADKMEGIELSEDGEVYLEALREALKE